MKRNPWLWLIPALLIAFLSAQSRAEAAGLTATPASLALEAGATAKIEAANANGTVRATVSNGSIAAIKVSGNSVTVTAKAAGRTSVKLRDKKGSVTVPITVTPKPPLSLTPASLTLAAGTNATLQAANVNGTLKATSAGTTIATATVSGTTIKVTAKRAGTTRIKVQDRKTTINVPVTVTAPAPAPALSLSPSAVILGVGGSSTVQASNVNGTLTASVANSAIAGAAVSGNTIKVTAKASGSTLITVKDSKTTANIAVTVTSSSAQTASYTLLAWNDLGMHCMDGDFSVFSILPPFNNLHAQLVDKTNNKLVTQGVTLSYEAMADADGSINSSSAGKSNFWQYDQALFGVDLTPNVGLTGNPTVSLTPSPLQVDAVDEQFVAEGIPITPIDDSNRHNFYPMVKVVARDAQGKQLAVARAVLPVSDEMSCANCHASNSGDAAKPTSGWVFDSQKERDWKRNILRLHDQKQAGKSAYVSALAAKGYQSAGLEATANGGKPILCAACHASNALPGTGVTGIKPLTEAIHSQHSVVNDPVSGQKMDDIANRSSCYQCHPGSATKCLRGVMGEATLADGNAAIDCQSCHGNMATVGKTGRVGWLDQPTCQACHHDGKRELTAIQGGIIKRWSDTRYASNPDTPAQGFSLYRKSAGHGDLQCEACHGATHAEYPSSHRNDNVLAQDVQGHIGTIGECTACHANAPVTATGGPHGLHTVGGAWVSAHGDYAEKGTSGCAYCHGSDFRGGDLSTVMAARSFNAEGHTVNYQAGQKVGCYDCHNGPNGD